MYRLRLLLLPFAWLYGAVLRIHHFLHDKGIRANSGTGIPAIVVGNIALGGTGKTPHVELVLRTLLSGHGADMAGPLATLSRGYGRTGNGFHEVRPMDDGRVVGDEPLMLKRKFTGVRVFVDADRVSGIKTIHSLIPDVRAVVLDDALQHRALKAGLNIVLTTWQRPWSKDHLLPAGNLRDLPYRARQVDVVIVTKCPKLPSPEQQHRWRKQLGLRPDQAFFFSGIEYAPPCSLTDSAIAVPTGGGTSALLFTGIADSRPLQVHAATLFERVKHESFGDHHNFTPAEQQRLARHFDTFATGEKTLLTTEKDAARLGPDLLSGPLAGLPIAVVGIRAVILNDPHAFEALIRTYVATHPTHR